MSFALSEHELYRACEVIFGPELAVSRDFLEYLQPAGIKSAFRKRAMETHPDRTAAAADHSAQRRTTELFHAVQTSYEQLLSYLKAREQGFQLPRRTHLRPNTTPRTQAQKPASQRPQPRPDFRRPRPRPQSDCRANTASQPASARTRSHQKHHDRCRPQPCLCNVDQLYRGPLPNRRLLLGHFLYYSGIASWRMVVQALIWQRTQRPRLGEIGQRFGMLQEEEVVQILRRKSLLEPFGASAVAQGFLTNTQLNMLILQQKRLQKKIGAYFLEKEILHRDQLNQVLRLYHQHNASLAVPAANARRRP